MRDGKIKNKKLKPTSNLDSGCGCGCTGFSTPVEHEQQLLNTEKKKND
ncbi:MAG: hypothetical protein ACFFAS_13980 [Promethearchaeota archaeon]